jgi:hypothetical protein
MPTTSGMKEGGYYDIHSAPQRAAMDAFLPWLIESINELPIPADLGSTLVILDLGSSHGGNAIHAMQRVVQGLRRRSTGPAWLFFSDLPTNDFNQLFSNLFPAGSRALTEAGVFTGAIAGSAYKPVVPPQSLHIATSFNMVGWLETKPSARIPRYISPMGPAAPSDRVSVSEAEREPYRLQAVADMRAFYRARAEELVHGGKLLVQVFGRTDAHSTSDGIYDVLSDALLEKVGDGSLPQSIYEDFVFPVYFRTVQELISPLDHDGELAGVFRVDRADVREINVPFNEELARTGDIKAWAGRYSDFLRAFSESVVAAAMPASGQVAEIVDDVYQRVEQLLVEDPGRYKFRYISVGALLTRT